MKKRNSAAIATPSTRARDDTAITANRKNANRAGLARQPIQRPRSDSDDASCRFSEASYKNPPKKSRWPQGKSGNPNGRKKGSKNKRTIIIEMMEAKLGRKIPDPKNLTRYEAMMLKGIQQALAGNIRAMSFVLGEYRKAIEASGVLTAAATTEEDQQIYNALCDKIRREAERDVREDLRAGNPSLTLNER